MRAQTTNLDTSLDLVLRLDEEVEHLGRVEHGLAVVGHWIIAARVSAAQVERMGRSALSPMMAVFHLLMILLNVVDPDAMRTWQGAVSASSKVAP